MRVERRLSNLGCRDQLQREYSLSARRLRPKDHLPRTLPGYLHQDRHWSNLSVSQNLSDQRLAEPRSRWPSHLRGKRRQTPPRPTETVGPRTKCNCSPSPHFELSVAGEE